MAWYPVGPDSVFAPKRAPFERLSRRNEYGRQGLVSSIAMDPTDPATIYVTERPSSGGTSAFRTRDDGNSWTPIADSLQQLDPRVDPSCIAVNPDNPTTIYMGVNQGVYVSSSRGDPGSWSARHAIPGYVRKLIVDSRTSATLATTVLYAATTAGVYRSADGGTTWNQVLPGDTWTLVAYMPSAGTAHFYAGVWQQGVFHTTDPTTPWTNLNTQGIGLPAHTAPTVAQPRGNFDAVFVDLCRQNPSCVYAWFTTMACSATGSNCQEVTMAIYTTSSPTTAWAAVAVASPPSPGQGLYAWSFAVAPNSPGDGLTDILLFGSLGVQRSIDGGRTWQNDGTSFHADQHAIAFSPEQPPPGVVPATYIGCDGGIGKSSKFVDPTVAISSPPGDYNEDVATLDTFAWQNRNHAKQSSAIYQYASDPRVPALSYIGCQDTGVAAGASALGWRGVADADGGAIATAVDANGIAVWASLGNYGGWAPFRIHQWRDKGDFYPAAAFVTLGGSVLASTSNYVVGLDGKCVAGAVARDITTTLTVAIAANAAPQAATPASMTGIVVGSVLAIDPATPAAETVTVTATTATTFTAVFTQNHLVGATVQPNRTIVVRTDGSGVATQISQEFVGLGRVFAVAIHPADANVLYCATRSGVDQRIWTTNAGAAAGPSTVWSEIATGKPANIYIGSVAVASSGATYVMLTSSVASGANVTPLFEVSTGAWVAQACVGLPGGFTFGKVVADPVQAGTLYAANGAKVYRLTLAGGTWTWTDISAALPGQWIYDLWVGNIGSAAVPKVLLRAAIPTRGVWEQDVSAGANDPPVFLYLRDNFLDHAWLDPSPEGMVNPYDPVSSDRVWHYHCADLKIDARQEHTIAGMADFFQTDPEGAPIPPLSHVLFDQLVDNSQNLPQTDAAYVHVQVHNRSWTPADNVSVWAIYCNPGAVPALSASPSMGNAFPFWGQFGAGGAITPSLPADSPWHSVGPPQVLFGIDAANPRVASWSWTIPALPSGASAHCCMVAFVHSAASPVGETTRMIVDQIAPTNRQVGQKNLHIGPPLAPGPASGDASVGTGTRATRIMEEYIEFHNPTPQAQQSEFRIDLRSLPADLATSFRLTKVTAASMTGIARARGARADERWGELGPPFSLLSWIAALFRKLVCWLANILRFVLNQPRKQCSRPRVSPLDLEPVVYEAKPSALVQVRGVNLPAFGSAAALLRVEVKGQLEQGGEYRFEVQQIIGAGEEKPPIVGGGTYVVVIAGDAKQRTPFIAPSHDPDTDPRERERIEREGDKFRYLPPWAEKLVEDREKEQYKR